MKAPRRYLTERALQTGVRVALLRTEERYPHFTVPEGAAGVVTVCDADLVAVKLDRPPAGSQEWGGELYFTADDAWHLTGVTDARSGAARSLRYDRRGRLARLADRVRGRL